MTAVAIVMVEKNGITTVNTSIHYGQYKNLCNTIKFIFCEVGELFMSKNILILGPSRAGKTTLTKKLNEELNYSLVCFDSIIYAFEQSFPQLGICFGAGAQNTATNLADFLIHYFRILSQRSEQKNGVKFAAEGGYFDFDKIITAINNDDMRKDFLFIGLVYNNKTPDELFDDIRKNDTEGDWSYNCDDDRANGKLRNQE